MTQLLLGPGASLALAPAADLEAADLSSADLAPAVGRAAEGRVPPAPKQPRAGAREGTEEQRCSHVTAEQPDQACDPVTPISSGALNRPAGPGALYLLCSCTYRACTHYEATLTMGRRPTSGARGCGCISHASRSSRAGERHARLGLLRLGRTAPSLYSLRGHVDYEARPATALLTMSTYRGQAAARHRARTAHSRSRRCLALRL